MGAPHTFPPIGFSAASAPFAALWAQRGPLGAIAVILFFTAFALFSETGAFTVDEFFYAEMAVAMAEDGRLAFQQMHLAGVEGVNVSFGMPVENGRLVPQYPSGYAFIAAPFYQAFGVDGLVLLNALSALACAALVHRLCRRAGGAGRAPAIAVLLFALCSIAPEYFFAIWPHMPVLALVLGAVCLALAAVEETASAFRAIVLAAAAGLLVGFGASVRADVILTGVAILAWFRGFVGRSANRQTFAFVFGLTPGLLFCASLNHAKFGVFHPFSYQDTVGPTEFSQYAPLLLAFAAVFALSFVIDAPQMAKRARRLLAAQLENKKTARFFLGTTGLAAVLAVVFLPSLNKIASSLWMLIVDLQILAEGSEIDGVSRDALGLTQFWGVYKKSLLQSLPFAPLVLPGLWLFLKGAADGTATRQSDALLWLMIGAFAMFYALNGFHGGLTLNLRYYIPVAALLCILAARAIPKFMHAAEQPMSAFRLSLILGLGVFAVLVLESLRPVPWRGVLELYPALLVAAVLMGLVVLAIARDRARDWRRVAHVGVFAIGAACAINMGDVGRDRIIRHINAEDGAALSALLPEGALVVTGDPATFVRVLSPDLTVIYPGLDDVAKTRAALDAYRAAGRCVAAHGGGVSYVRDVLGLEPRHAHVDLNIAMFGGCSPALK